MYYCSEGCQTKDWPSHKKDCQAVQAHKKLFRAGELLQYAFLATRADAFDLYITRIETFSDDTLHFWDAREPQTSRMGAPLLDNFDVDPKIKQAILSMNANADVLSMTFELGQSSFGGEARERCLRCLSLLTSGQKGHVANVEKLTVRISDEQVSMYRHIGRGREGTCVNTHHILCITLKDQSTWAFGIAGAQHYQYHAVLSFDDYSRDYVRKVLQRQPYVTGSRRPEKPARNGHPLDEYDKEGDLSGDTDHQQDKLCQWEYLHQPLRTMLKAKKADYEASNMQHVNILATAARKYVKLTGEDSASRAKADLAWQLYAIGAQKEYQESEDRKDARYMAKFNPGALKTVERMKIKIARQKESAAVQ